jgi:hypothetical protein
MLVITTPEINLGDLKQNEIKEFEFTVSNNSEQLVSVMLSVSCGCTIPSISPNPIPANQSAIVKAKFDTTGKSGFQKKTIYLEYMEGNDKLKLNVPFKANIL